MAPKRTKPGSTGRAQVRAQRTRERLLDAARREFADKGVDATTIENITEEADVGKGTFYLHFGSKEEAMVSLVEDAAGQLVSAIRSGADGPKTLEEMLARLLGVHADFFHRNPEDFLLLFQGRLLLQLRRESPEELEQPYVEYLNAIEDAVGSFLPRRVDQTKVRHLACALAGFVSGFLSFAMVGMSDEEMETSLQPLRGAFIAAATSFLGRDLPGGLL